MVEYSPALIAVPSYAYHIAKQEPAMNVRGLKDNNATVCLTAPEVKLLCVMSQYWLEMLPDDDPGTKQFSDQLRELACRFDIH